MKKLALNKETVRKLAEQDLVRVQGGISGGNCHISKSCYSIVACNTDIC